MSSEFMLFDPDRPHTSWETWYHNYDFFSRVEFSVEQYNSKQDRFYIACNNGDLKTFNKLLCDPDVDPLAQNQKALNSACFHNWLDMVKKLIEIGSNPLYLHSVALHIAIQKCSYDVAKYLITTFICDPSRSDNQCIIDACCLLNNLNSTRIVKLLLEDERVDPTVRQCITVRHAKSHEILHLLSKHPKIRKAYDCSLIKRSDSYTFRGELHNVLELHLMIRMSRVRIRVLKASLKVHLPEEFYEAISLLI